MTINFNLNLKRSSKFMNQIIFIIKGKNLNTQKKYMLKIYINRNIHFKFIKNYH